MYCDNFLSNFKIKKLIELRKKYLSKIIFSVTKKKFGQKGTIILNKNKLIYKKNINSDFVELGYMLVNKEFFFNNLIKFKGNKLSNYLQYLSKKNKFVGHYYGNNFLCIENQKLILETKNFFKIK